MRPVFRRYLRAKKPRKVKKGVKIYRKHNRKDSRLTVRIQVELSEEKHQVQRQAGFRSSLAYD